MNMELNLARKAVIIRFLLSEAKVRYRSMGILDWVLTAACTVTYVRTTAGTNRLVRYVPSKQAFLRSTNSNSFRVYQTHPLACMEATMFSW